MFMSFASKCVSTQTCKGGLNEPFDAGHNEPPNLAIVKCVYIKTYPLKSNVIIL